MAKGNPRVQFRVRNEVADWLAAQGAMSEIAGKIVEGAYLLDTRGVGSTEETPESPEEGSTDERTEQGAGAGNRPAPTEPPPAENALARATRVRREWADLERDHPTLAREIGSYDEYARRNG